MPEDLRNIKNIAFSKPASYCLGVGFGARSNELAATILQMDQGNLVDAWKASASRLAALYVPVEDELRKASHSAVSTFLLIELIDSKGNQSEHLKRTHDYDPFIREYLTKLNSYGVLRDILEVDASGRPVRKPQPRQSN